jgi:transposase-like protein
MPGSDNVPTRQGLFDWTHGAPVRPPFWNQAKKVLRIHNGIHTDSFLLFLKEREFGFNYGTPKQQLEILMLWGDI